MEFSLLSFNLSGLFNDALKLICWTTGQWAAGQKVNAEACYLEKFPAYYVIGYSCKQMSYKQNSQAACHAKVLLDFHFKQD